MFGPALLGEQFLNRRPQTGISSAGMIQISRSLLQIRQIQRGKEHRIKSLVDRRLASAKDKRKRSDEVNRSNNQRQFYLPVLHLPISVNETKG